MALTAAQVGQLDQIFAEYERALRFGVEGARAAIAEDGRLIALGHLLGAHRRINALDPDELPILAALAIVQLAEAPGPCTACPECAKSSLASALLEG